LYNVKDDANSKARVKVDLKHLQQQIAELQFSGDDIVSVI
jgi:hypothetical protein